MSSEKKFDVHREDIKKIIQKSSPPPHTHRASVGGGWNLTLDLVGQIPVLYCLFTIAFSKVALFSSPNWDLSYHVINAWVLYIWLASLIIFRNLYLIPLKQNKEPINFEDLKIEDWHGCQRESWNNFFLRIKTFYRSRLLYLPPPPPLELKKTFSDGFRWFEFEWVF